MADQRHVLDKYILSNLVNIRLERVQKKRQVFKVIRNMILTAIVCCLLFGVIFGIGIVQGDSMLPALKEGDLLVFFRLSDVYQTGDIVRVQKDAQSSYVKRIIAGPGQTLDIDSRTKKILIDGKALSEPYIYDKTDEKTGVEFPLTLKPEEYFILGDHRENSQDSRNFGPVEEKQICGKVIAVLHLES